jgi:hypothetical protein
MIAVLRDVVILVGSLMFLALWAAIAQSTYKTMRNRKEAPLLGVGPPVYKLTEEGRRYSARSWLLFLAACGVAVLTFVLAKVLSR